MDKSYDPSRLESQWYQFWEENGYFEPKGDKEPYTIMIPPPNVTGNLHMGHAFQDAIIDALIRYHRMRGHKTLWQVGTDHAGIATQMVVERKLQAEENKTRHDLGRNGFIEKVWQWKSTSGNTIIQQLRRLGASVDWKTERFTMDDGFYKAVQEVFIRLYEQKLIYRGKRLVNWDPKLHTAISDLEVISEEANGSLWHIRYPLAKGKKTSDGKGYVIVATTRPETMLGDAAIAVHPDDTRYQSLIGQFVTLPLVNRLIPIIADDYVDQNFGSGCVKITPAHDFNDYEVGKRHQLPLINVMTKSALISKQATAFNFDGTVNQKVSITIPEAFQDLDRFVARNKMINTLKELDLLEKTEDHAMSLPRGDRSGEIIEPYLTDQWFVKTEQLAKPAIKAVEKGDIKFVPEQYKNMYFSWMRGIQDWCISRQLWWGHRIPAWYDQNGNVYVGSDEQTIRTKHKIKDDIILTQDNDVLDTWFSSSLWTFATLGWPEDTEQLRTFHPTQTLVTGFDIIFFWVARMIMMTMHFVKDKKGNPQVPFKTVYVHGLVRDQEGQKMSKSKGNVLDPLDLIDGIDLETLIKKRVSNMMQPELSEKVSKQTRKQFPKGISSYGTDALRYTFYSLASTGRDIKFDMGRIEGYRNFCNKIWNATRYVLSHLDDFKCDKPAQFSLPERWIQSRLENTISNVDQAMAAFRLDHASHALYDFLWNEYCDWYLELSKPILWDKEEILSPEIKQGTCLTLVKTLETILKLLHPFMPFITEEIWQTIKGKLGKSGKTIMLEPWPTPDEQKIDTDAENNIFWLKEVITAIREIRGEMNVAPSKKLDILLMNVSNTDRTYLKRNDVFLRQLAKLNSLRILSANEKPPISATKLVGEMEILVPMAGIIDKEMELSRLRKDINLLDKEIERIDTKLNNPKFIDNAPKDIINKESEKLKKAQTAIEQLKLKQIEIQSM